MLIEGGRATADPQNGQVRYNFYNARTRQLCFATWFSKEEKSEVVRPLSEEDADAVEVLYQMAVEATSSLGKGLDSVLKEEKQLSSSDGEYKVMIQKTGGNILSMKKKPMGWFGNTYDLQRGYTEYTVEGEEEEMILGPVKHLIFVIHGVGQAFVNREDIKMMNMVEEIDAMRLIIQRRQIAEWKRACDKAKRADEPEPPPPSRIEVLPIEWWEKIRNSSSELIRSLQATTLRTIPGLRSIANDVVFDVLMYLTPTFCESVLTCVTDQIIDLYHGFQKIHPEFAKNGGKYSLVGHSLGSVIAWDLLAILKSKEKASRADDTTDDDLIVPFFCGGGSGGCGYQAYAAHQDDEEINAIKNGSWGPSLPKPLEKSIPFVPEFTIFLGSPIGMFLTLRGAHAVFSEMLHLSVQVARAKATEAVANAEAAAANAPEGVMVVKGGNKKDDSDRLASAVVDQIELPITSPFTLPTGSLYNIFHPSDPVAYRIEPLLLSKELVDTDMPPPEYLTRKGQKARLHVQAKEFFGNGLVRSLQGKRASVRDFFSTAASVLQTMGNNSEEGAKRSISDSLKQGPLKFPLGGQTERIDYCIQPGVIENEYFAAVTAHSCYFQNPDVIDFMLDLTDGFGESTTTPAN